VARAAAGADDAATEVRKLVAEGKKAEAVALLQGKSAAAATAQIRFRLRLDLARLLMETGEVPVARAVFAGLDEEMRSRGLEEWDPALAATCLERHMECLQALARAGQNVSADTDLIYNRLCRLDPVAAARLGFDRTTG
jgi:type VI secretion system protein VasJ